MRDNYQRKNIVLDNNVLEEVKEILKDEEDSSLSNLVRILLKSYVKKNSRKVKNV